ncbi:MAG: hypothetical protein JXB49_24460 [Bacteroidales bacterium]|nr:hypothetical protein [Bacteroidales bacterium]
MKIIISHDVDHLYPSDHILRDLIFPKLWIRSAIEMIKGKISFFVFNYRLMSIFDKRLNRIPEIVDFDKENNIPSIFLFGMSNILGMSYKISAVAPWIKYVLENGFDAGVHGVEYDDIDKMSDEFNRFQAISDLDSFGIRMHYVRYNNSTFMKMDKIGYLFDTTEFSKSASDLKKPYKISNMWEFPLYIMDGYILNQGFESAKKQTINLINKASKIGIEYFTFLFHDNLFNEKTYPMQKDYYVWFVKYVQDLHLKFISYRDAIEELEFETKSNKQESYSNK